jgi:hypothetical protein
MQVGPCIPVGIVPEYSYERLKYAQLLDLSAAADLHFPTALSHFRSFATGHGRHCHLDRKSQQRQQYIIPKDNYNYILLP